MKVLNIRIIFGVLVFISGCILTICEENIIGFFAGLIGLYFIFIK